MARETESYISTVGLNPAKRQSIITTVGWFVVDNLTMRNLRVSRSTGTTCAYTKVVAYQGRATSLIKRVTAVKMKGK